MKPLNKITKRIILIVIIIISVLGMLKCASIIGHHQYDSVEEYSFKISPEELLFEIHKFKELNPNLKPPENLLYPSSDPEFDIPLEYFYYADKHDVLMTLVISKANGYSSLGFNSVINLEDNSRKEINFSFGCSDNRKQLKLFEDRIVNPLRKQIRDKYKKKN